MRNVGKFHFCPVLMNILDFVFVCPCSTSVPWFVMQSAAFFNWDDFLHSIKLLSSLTTNVQGFCHMHLFPDFKVSKSCVCVLTVLFGCVPQWEGRIQFDSANCGLRQSKGIVMLLFVAAQKTPCKQVPMQRVSSLFLFSWK